MAKSTKILKFIIPLLVSIIIVVILYLIVRANLKPTVTKITPIPMDFAIQNDTRTWAATSDNASPYQIPFIKITSISFSTDTDSLYIKYNLAGKLPAKDEILPSFSDDKITDAIFSMDFYENYFDASGHKNPSNPEARVKVNIYGPSTNNPAEGITVNGTLVEGGPGNSFFTAKFPYQQLLFSQTKPLVVFSAAAVANSEKFNTGASRFEMSNGDLAATINNPKEIKVLLRLKS